MKIVNVESSKFGIFLVTVSFIKDVYEPDSEMKIEAKIDRMIECSGVELHALGNNRFRILANIYAASEGHAKHLVSEAIKGLQKELSKGKFWRIKKDQKIQY